MAHGRRQDALGIVADSQWIVAFARYYGYDQCLPGVANISIGDLQRKDYSARREEISWCRLITVEFTLSGFAI